MDFRQLYYFLSVCEHNCIAQAAQSLFISPQALSKAISQLEKEFQMSLFSRTPQGLILTEAGEQLRTLGLPILESVTALQGEMASLYQRSQGVLLLGITSTLDFFLGATAFEKFQSTHSPYKIVVNEHSHTDCEDSVASGAMFAALTYGSSDKPSVKTIPLMKRQRVCLVPKDSPLAKKSLIRISDLRGYPIVSSINSYSLNMFNNLCRDRGFDSKIYRVDDITTMLVFCHERGCIGITIDYLLLRSFPWRRNLIALPIALDEFYSPVNLIVNSAAYERKDVQEIISYIQDLVLEKNKHIPTYPFEFHE